MKASSGGIQYPVGDSNNPITINDPGGHTFDVSVTDGITENDGVSPATDWAVYRTWTISCASAATITVTPQWDETTDLAGADFDLHDAFVSSRDITHTNIWTPGTGSDISAQSNPYTVTSSSISITAGDVYNIGVGGGTLSQLPVTLVNFGANYINNAVHLNWNTASEINNNYFGIERSIDGETWQTISQVAGHGNSKVMQNYTYIDNLIGIIPAGIFYYRLKQVDFNDDFTCSIIRAVNVNSSIPVLMTYPNPIVNTFTVTWTSTSNDNSILKLVNMSGIIVFQENVDGLGEMQKQLDLSSYPAGMYFLQVISGNDKIESRMIVKN
jgi:hypothetical protein